jgi:holo-[acyl-carrier protein] synthase
MGNVIAHGIDLIECERVATMRARHGDRFMERILTAREREYVEQFRNPVERIAGRFAAKEAVLKVLGTGWVGRIAWTDIEILNDEAGVPIVTLGGECARIAKARGIDRMLVSITHTRTYAAASALGLTD